MTRRKSSLVLLLAASIGSVITVWATHSQGQDPKAPPQKDATPVTEGIMTEKQIEHSKLYTQAGRRKKITTDDSGAMIIIGLPWADELTKNNLSFKDYLRDMTCKADAVVLGNVRSKASQLTADGTFIFTDYELGVEDVLKNNLTDYIQPKSEITVTRPGGVVSLNGKIISVKDKSFKLLEVDRLYLFFLTYLPSSGAYKSLSSEAGFEVSKNQLLRLTEEQPSYKLCEQKDKATTINEIRLLTNNCDNQGGGK
jgi:hypothetical protein